MPDAGLTISFEVYCSKCGAGLCNQSKVDSGGRNFDFAVRVDPCEKCLDDREGAGYNEGLEEGRKEVGG